MILTSFSRQAPDEIRLRPEYPNLIRLIRESRAKEGLE
jgi:hypothetical protein